MIRVIIVEDERILREGIKKIISENIPQITIVGTVGNGNECLDMLQPDNADLIIADIRMPYMDGLELMKNVREKGLETDFIVLSGYDDFHYCRNALKCNAIDYLLKPIDKNEFISVLKKYVQNHDTADIENSMDKRVIREIKNYVRMNFNKSISLSDLSIQFHMNPAYISQFFKKETGVTLTDYITDIRIEKAKIALRDRAIRIDEIANNVGYESPKHFSSTFKRITGRTPSEYREEIE